MKLIKYLFAIIDNYWFDANHRIGYYLLRQNISRYFK